MKQRMVLLACCVGAAVLAVAVAALATGGSGTPGKAAAAILPVANLGVAPANAVEQTVEQAENASLATLSPLATTQSQSMNCLASECSLSSSWASLDSLPDAANSLVDNPTTGVGKGIEASIRPSGNSTSMKSALSLNTIVKRNTTLLGNLFSATLANEYERSNDRVVSTEIQDLNGTFAGCTSKYICTIVGAAGSEVTSFTNVQIGTTTATVTLKVHGWQDDAHYTGPTGALSWQRIAGTLLVKDTLQKLADGTWQVVKGRSTFADGSGP
jgi:hypothetical protein